MIYLLVALAVAIWLLWRWSSLKTREAAFGAETAAMGREEAEAELARIRQALTAHYAGIAPLEAAAADRLAERGGWVADRLAGLQGAQTGAAPRIRARMALVEQAQEAASG